ncbi:hypothetical protein O9K51_10807 [Purpureocillium lavendulum]|uniref:Heterokaryon incompatibility domain-containing protein n=1 Tax=Purpureocillium lavendulum TaxID=1247861 RepID=A0AB34FBX8_9HYPO|nr:hypothetical protein O9K51_10807 [Purpureocillium lavendulum]
MEQVALNHGTGISEIRTPGVVDLLERRTDIEPPKSFPEFCNFPKLCGWEVLDDHSLRPLKSGKPQTLAFFIQAWLFFGLTLTVVQKDNKPILSVDRLHADGYLSTHGLHDAIEEWTEWEKCNKDGSRFRSVQVGWVLDRVRRIIQKTYAYDYAGDQHTCDEDDTGSVNGGEMNDLIDSPHPDDKDLLVVMCLGETLSAAKARIVEMNTLGMAGWHGDDYAGWGPPRWVFSEMNEKKWCPRAIEILRGQVSTNATMLVAAYQAYQKSTRMTGEHRQSGCTRQECKVKSKDEKGNYQNRHHGKCKTCKSYGPFEDEIVKVLREDNRIPLLVIRGERTEELCFEVKSFNPDNADVDFVTISHVWSDGWGNETENKLNRCQLKFIQRQIFRATGKTDTPFWMDTLVVPVSDAVKDCRRRAIRQIFQVFDLSSHTIVLDNGLSGMDNGATPAEAAMKIFSSAWMRRLWTLQEAYRSRRICIPFAEGSQGTNTVRSFEDIEEQLEKLMKRPTSGITQTIRIQLSRMIMGEERRFRNGGANKRGDSDVSKKKYATLVANAYRAARWRTTGKAEHEVLALATLLNLNTKMTPKIEAAGLDAPAAPAQRKEPVDYDRLEDLVCEFWEELHKQYNAIPSGVIFLPGEKVNRKAFGWAPRTWLSAYEMDYPDPLSFWDKPTDFNKENGLGVRYRGFLLHPGSQRCRSRILGTSVDEGPFIFPIDRSLSECYSIQRLEDPAASGQPNELTRQVTDNTQLAVILSGALPRESPREIALLVEVERLGKQSRSDDALDERAVEYRASIIHSILIWRDASHLKNEDGRLGFMASCTGGAGEDRDICLGEALDQTQRWWVDRPVQPSLEDLAGVRQGVGQQAVDEFRGGPLTRQPTTFQKILSYFSSGY